MARDNREIIAQGLARALEKNGDGLALARYYMDELARFLVYGCDETDEFASEYRAFSDEIMGRGMSVSTRATLVSELCRSALKYFEEKGKGISVRNFFKGEELDGGRITYVKNAVADEAYRIFASVIKNASVSYSGSFISACEEVYYGRVPYCILPYETSEEGTLSGFMKLIRKYELYPHYVCVCGGENSATRLALLSRSPCADGVEGETDAYLKLTFYRPEQDTLLRLSAAQNELSLTHVRTESFPVSFEDGKYGLDVTVYGRASDVLPFLLYTELEVPECSDKAIYRQID